MYDKNKSGFDLNMAQQGVGAFQSLLTKIELNINKNNQVFSPFLANKLVAEFQQLNFPKKQRKSFIEIMKLRFREDVSSRTLAFFLDTMEEHDLDDLVLNALLKASGRHLDYQVNSQKVTTEVITNIGRIDIMVETSEFIVVIENKINHHAENNPFDDYIAYAKIKNTQNKELIFILLGMKKPKIMPKSFEFISHFDLSRLILNDLGQKTLQADQYYLTYLIDYIALIEQDNPNSEYGKMQMDIVNFYRNNREILEQIESEENKSSVYTYYEKELKKIIEELQARKVNIFPESLEFEYVEDRISSIGSAIDSNSFEFMGFSLIFELVKATDGVYLWMEGHNNKTLKIKDIELLSSLLKNNGINIVEQDGHKASIQLLEEAELISAEKAADFIIPIVSKIMALQSAP